MSHNAALRGVAPRKDGRGSVRFVGGVESVERRHCLQTSVCSDIELQPHNRQPAICMVNRVSKYTWQESHRRVDRARDALGFSVAMIRILEEAGDYADPGLWALRLVKEAAADVLRHDGLLGFPSDS